MTHAFYQPFDLERRDPDPPAVREDEYRTAFQIDRDRIVFSYPFRRLQSKTQVFQSGEYDFYRTRLTHSMEVAKIGRSICEFLRANSEHLNDRFHIDPDLAEGVGLAHDLGHPPFGHIGERKLNALMAGFGGFEGNAQTLRIIAGLIYERPEGVAGMDPTRALLDGVMKYRRLHREASEAEAAAPDPSGAPPRNHFLYDDQATLRAHALGGEGFDGAPAEAPKSIECQIMDWADDTAYSLNDIVDGVHARYISVGALDQWAEEQAGLDAAETEAIERLQGAIRQGVFERKMSARIASFIHGTRLVPRGGALAARTRRHAFDLAVDPAIRREADLYQRIARDLIFRSPQIQQIEFKGGFILERLFNALAEHYGERPGEGLRLLPPRAEQLILRADSRHERYRRICDALAALTDAQAMRTYKRLFDPDFGSIAELL